MNTYKILSASGVTMKQVKVAFIKNAAYETNIWWATPGGAQFAPQKGDVELLLHKTLYELLLPTNTLTPSDVFAWGYEVLCKCSIVLEEVKKLSEDENKKQAKMFREMGRRNDLHRYSLL